MRFARSSHLALAVATLVAAGACGSDDPVAPDPPTITVVDLPDGTVGEQYTAAIAAAGGEGEYEWDVVSGALPPGLGISVEDLGGAELIISGIPETAGTFTFDLRVRTPDGGSDTEQFEIDIQDVPLTIGTAALVPALVGYPYTVQLEAVGAGADEATWSIVEGSLPAGLSLSETGQFSGSASAATTVEIVVEAVSGSMVAQDTFELRVVQENTGRFDITVLAAVPIPAQLQDNVAEAIRRWEAAIVGNLSRIDVAEGSLDLRNPDGVENICTGFTHLADGTSIDDLIVIVNIGPIDEDGSFKPTADGDSVFTNTIGSASPCFIRDDDDVPNVGDIPIVGVLTLDEFDLFTLEEDSQELATDLIQHEIAHILGLGSLWNYFGLLEGSGTDDPRYTGEEGVAAYQAAGGDSAAIPVENLGPPGTREGHWRESVFDDELMTGGLRRTSFLSAMSIASFADFGYAVDTSAAEGELTLGTLAGYGAPVELWLHGDVGTAPIIGLTRDGQRSFVLTPYDSSP